MNIIIRKATADDAANILEYCKAVGAETDNLTFVFEGINAAVESEQEYLESIYNSEKSVYLIAECDGKIVGSCHYNGFTRKRIAHRGEIGISVKKNMWGQHIGTRFMEKLIDFAKNTAHAEIISLEVRTDNERAKALYRKFGFEMVGTFKGYMKIDDKYIDCDFMRLCLQEQSKCE